jgi:ribonucleoside-diphosphate reductase alpha subunit
MINTYEDIQISVADLCKNKKYLNIELISQKIYDGKSNTNIDNYEFYKLFLNVCDDLTSTHYEYSELGAIILYKQNNIKIKELNLETFVSKVNYINKHLPKYLNQDYVLFVNANTEFINNIIFNLELPKYIDFFGYKTLEGSYLIKVNDIIIEQPVDMFLRTAISIHFRSSDENKYDLIVNTFNLMFEGLFTHATPTLYNSGTNHEQLSSCFLLGTEDSLNGIFKTFKDAGDISKWSGGLGIHISNIRAKDSIISTTNGVSSGIIPMLKIYNDIARYINQGGRGKKRPGAIAIYIEPWHADIEEFLELKLNTGTDETRARDLFLALWIPDLYMKQLEKNDDWYLMCPNECPGLIDVYGDEFEKLYWEYVEAGKYRKKIKALDIFIKISISLAETGIPYILYKDNINKKSNQSNIGVIKSSNLCAEIVEVSDNNTYAVCNLASIAINKFINEDNTYNFNKLKEVAEIVTKNLNNIIDINYYPTPETQKSNITTRPIGIGIQGLADLLLILKIPYESEDALKLEANIMETIYYGAITESIKISKIDGPYDKFEGSPFSKGIFQFDMWDKTYDRLWDWDIIREQIKLYGIRNSLLTALMPTASTSQILGNMECFEPLTSNIYTRKTAVGLFKIINKYLINDLIKLNLWNDNMKNKIIRNNGSIQAIEEIPSDLKLLYKTVWEIKQKSIIDHALIRSPYIDQTQSMNLYFSEIDINKVKSALFYGWKKGIKTGCYYMRSEPASKPSNITDDTNECTTCSA